MEDKKNERFLPIGSVVLLEGGTKKAMITGFCSIAEDDKDKVYDYTGCIYPEGYLDFNQICLFDHSQISKVYHLGYVDDEEKAFKKELTEIVTNIENGTEKLTDYVSDVDFEDEEEDDDDTPLIIPSVEDSDENKEEYEYL